MGRNSTLSSSVCAQDDEYMTDIDIVLTFSATTSCPQLGMSGVPGYTFYNGGPGACGDGWFPIDGQLLGNGYRAPCSPMVSHAKHDVLKLKVTQCGVSCAAERYPPWKT